MRWSSRTRETAMASTISKLPPQPPLTPWTGRNWRIRGRGALRPHPVRLRPHLLANPADPLLWPPANPLLRPPSCPRSAHPLLQCLAPLSMEMPRRRPGLNLSWSGLLRPLHLGCWCGSRWINTGLPPRDPWAPWRLTPRRRPPRLGRVFTLALAHVGSRDNHLE